MPFMRILVANLGSTSFKFRLYDLGEPGEPLLARGAVERIGAAESCARILWPGGERETTLAIADHGAAMQLCLDTLADPAVSVLHSAEEVAAIGFKAVHSRDHHNVHRVDESLLASMESFSDVAPAHNPPYIQAMRILAQRFPQLPLVAAFETDFHTTIPEATGRYAIPDAWTALGVRKWGFHGASHRYISWRMTELLGRSDLKLISCHLGGSSSLCAIRNGLSIATSMGMSPQTGLPHNNRVGDFDPFALPVIMRATGLSLADVLATLAKGSGLEGVGGAGCDLRDIELAAVAGNARAQLAIDLFVNAIRHYLGALLFELGGADAIVFTAGIGENSSAIRAGVLRNLAWFGIALDPDKNAATRGGEVVISTPSSRVPVWVVPTNEEIVVARQTRDLLQSAAF
jgi:acetate kinase